MRFLYVMDPMCSWCYGFQPELEAFLAQHSVAPVDWVMGGLAPDTKQAMDSDLKQSIAAYWHQIEEKTQVTFNHDFWDLNTAYRSTYPACRAVISAESLLENASSTMVKAIQRAYYQLAKNPSLELTLIECADSIGLDKNAFVEALTSEETERQLQQHFTIAQQLQVRGFPALFYLNDQLNAFPLAHGFCKTDELTQRFLSIKT